MAEGFFDVPTNRLRQDDIFEPMAFVRIGSAGFESPKTSDRQQWAMLLNQSCDIDKPAFDRLVVVPIVPLSVLSTADQTNVKKNKIFSRLHLPSYREVLPETFVQFPEPMTVDRAILQKLRRVASLSEEDRRALYVQYVRWLTRWMLAELPCPRCGVTFRPADTLPVEND